MASGAAVCACATGPLSSNSSGRIFFIGPEDTGGTYPAATAVAGS